MRVLFLNPPFRNAPFSRSSRSPAVTKSGTLYYPVWLAYAAGVLEKDGFEIKLIDGPARRLSESDVVKAARAFDPDVIVVDTSTPSIYSDVETASSVKAAVKKAFVILVGTHPSALPEETLGLSRSIDAVAIGEYDHTIRDLCRALGSGRGPADIPGISFRRGDAIVHNGKRPSIEDLDGLPFVTSVYKRHLNVKDYFFAASFHPFVMIMTGRGCPFGCSFCVYPQVFHPGKCRFRSAGSVADEFEYVKRELPHVKEIGIEDDTFTVDPKRTGEICRELINRKVKMPWYANVRADLDLETMVMMKKAGCRLIIAGFESGSQEVLDKVHKGVTVERMERFSHDAKRAGLLVHGCFMIGNPGDRLDTVLETIDFAIRLNCDTAQFFPLMVYPGTEAYEWARDNGYLSSERFSDWVTAEGLHNTVVSTEHFSNKELVRLANYARRRFYMRPGYIIYKMARCLADPSELARTLISLRTFYRHLV